MNEFKELLDKFADEPFEKKAQLFNMITEHLSNFLGIEHPVLNLKLVPIEDVLANDYNPNKVAPPEMKLLKLSIKKDGLTMPVVVAQNTEGKYVVVDGFHRTTVCQSEPAVRESLNGYLPVSLLNKSIEDRVTATVRHNMARGTHQVELSAKLVTFLKKHNWTNARIGQELGMEPDEILRLKQMTGLAEAFSDKEFSKAWEVQFTQE